MLETHHKSSFRKLVVLDQVFYLSQDKLVENITCYAAITGHDLVSEFVISLTSLARLWSMNLEYFSKVLVKKSITWFVSTNLNVFWSFECGVRISGCLETSNFSETQRFQRITRCTVYYSLFSHDFYFSFSLVVVLKLWLYTAHTKKKENDLYCIIDYKTPHVLQPSTNASNLNAKPRQTKLTSRVKKRQVFAMY